MPSVAEMARVTASTHPRPGDHAADLTAEAAWLIHTAAVEAAQRDPSTTRTNEGYLIVVDNLKARAKFLYPEIAWEDPLASQEFIKPIYYYLRTRGAATVLKRNIDGDKTKSLWLLAPTFDAVPSQTRKYVMSTRERRLTAAEVGEDRTPAPVKVARIVERKWVDNGDGTYTCCDRVFTSQASLRGHCWVHGPGRRKRAKGNHTGPGFANLVPGQGPNSQRTDDPALPWGCPDCSAKYPSAPGLAGHRKVHGNSQANREATKAAQRKARRGGRKPTTLARVAPVPAPVASAPIAPIPMSNADVNAALAVLANALTSQDTSALTAQVANLSAKVAEIAAERDALAARFEAARAAFAA